MQSTDDKIYTGTVTFGRIMADIKAIVGTLIGLVAIAIGIFMVKTKYTKTKTTQSTISDVKCNQITLNSGNSTWNCKFTASYTIDNNKYTKQLSSDNQLFEGSEITLYYNPNNINEISTEKDIAHVIGWFCIGFGVLIIISSIVWAWLANRYKVVAAVGGVQSGLSIFSNIFR